MKISPWRALKLVFKLIFCLLFVLPTVWLALPFPTVSIEERSAFIQSALADGQTVVTAWDVKPFIKTGEGGAGEGWCSECTSVLFHWRFARVGGKVHILLAPHPLYNGDGAFEVPGHFTAARDWNHRATGARNESWSPYFADLVSTPITIHGAREDKRISQGWFHEVDRHLIHHRFYGWTTKVDIRALIPAPGRIEFWRGAAIDRAVNHISNDWEESPNITDLLQDYTQTAEIYDQMKHTERERDIDLIASFEAPENPNIKDIMVQKLKGDLASRTWPVRQKLLNSVPHFIVGPVMLFKAADDFLAPRFAGFLVALMTLPLIYVGVVGCCWIVAGSPDIFRWVSWFWMTRFLVPRRWREGPQERKVWGASGPVGSVFGGRGSEGWK